MAKRDVQSDQDLRVMAAAVDKRIKSGLIKNKHALAGELRDLSELRLEQDRRRGRR